MTNYWKSSIISGSRKLILPYFQFKDHQNSRNQKWNPSMINFSPLRQFSKRVLFFSYTLYEKLPWLHVTYITYCDKLLTKVGYMMLLIGRLGSLLRSLKIALWTIPPRTKVIPAITVKADAMNGLDWLSYRCNSWSDQERSKILW